MGQEVSPRLLVDRKRRSTEALARRRGRSWRATDDDVDPSRTTAGRLVVVAQPITSSATRTTSAEPLDQPYEVGAVEAAAVGQVVGDGAVLADELGTGGGQPGELDAPPEEDLVAR
jgi:hypothetical protein